MGLNITRGSIPSKRGLKYNKVVGHIPTIWSRKNTKEKESNSIHKFCVKIYESIQPISHGGNGEQIMDVFT